MSTATASSPPIPGGPLAGRVALVTGGTRGIGGAISHRLAAEGAEVAGGYWRQAEAAEKFLAEVTAQHPGRNITLHNGNIGSAEDCRRVVREVIEQHGRLDILVNNAGITIDRTVRKMTDEDWQRVITINLSGAFFVAQAALEHMMERGSRAHHQCLLRDRRDRQHRPGQLRGVEVGPVRADQVAGPRGHVHARPRGAPGR